MPTQTPQAIRTAVPGIEIEGHTVMMVNPPPAGAETLWGSNQFAPGGQAPRNRGPRGQQDPRRPRRNSAPAHPATEILTLQVSRIDELVEEMTRVEAENLEIRGSSSGPLNFVELHERYVISPLFIVPELSEHPK